MIAIAYVLCAGAPFTDAAHLMPFAPFGVRGIFSAASVVFFAFVGFDSVATVAEEVREPALFGTHGLHNPCESVMHIEHADHHILNKFWCASCLA